MKDNFIVANIKIKEGDLKRKIINSYENMKREWPNNMVFSEVRNEESIKECQISINGEKIDFTYDYNFPKLGDYVIKYEFPTPLKNPDFMFYGCFSYGEEVTLDLSKLIQKK